MAIRLDEARLRLLKIVDTSNTVKIYPNTVSSYGGLAVEGYTKGGYQGIHLGSSTNYMTVMSGEDQQGLYNQAAGRWIIYYKRTSDAIGIGTSDLVANNRVTITNNASITNLLTVGYGTTHYGIKVGNTYINAINGDLILQNNNTIRFGADDWDYNKWAGLKYNPTNKYIYLGIADGTIFSANSSQSGGRILTPGIGHFHVGNQTNYYFASNGDIVSNTLKVGIAADQATSPGVGIQVHDLRNVTPLPGMFGDRQVNFYFDQITDDYGGSSGTKWMSIMHMKGWTGSYSAWELAGNADNSSSQDTLRYRQGRDSTWGDWQSILTDANFTTYLDGTYVNASGDTITGTLILSKSQDASGTANNKPALIVGGTDTQAHIEIDNNEVMAKTNGTSVAELHLNADGGKVNIGNGGLYVGTGGISTGGNITASASNTDDRWVRATNSNGSVSTYTSTNRGLYDHTRSGWIIYDKKDDNTWVYIPIALKVESSTDSTSTSTGAIVTAGGIGVAKNIYSGQKINAVQGFGIASTAGTGVGISLYNGSTGTSAPTYGLMFAKTASFSSHVDVSGDWATYLTMSDTLNRGWIFRRGSTNVASISGSGIGAFAGITKDTMHILTPAGGHYYTSDSTKTGYLKITLPVSWTSAMVRFIVDIYDYSEDNTVTYIIGGYNYVNDSKWYSMSAQCISKWGTGKSNLDVRFGHDGSKCAIYIGASNTSWSYPQVVIRDVVIGYGQYSKISDWSKNWSISFTTSLGTITGTKNNTNTGYSVNYSGSSGYAAEAGALRSPNNGTLAYLDWTGQQTSCTWFATWDETTYSGKPTVRAMSATNMRKSLGTLSATLANGYYGMGRPDGNTSDWIRTTVNGIIPYQSGGSSALGTESWPFSNIWSKTVNIIDTYYPAFRLTAQTVNSFSTYSKGMFEVNYTDSIGMWIHSDKTTDAKSRRALVVYGWGAKSDAAQAVALRQCNTSGTWLNDLYLLHSGNYSSYAMPTSYWSWSGQSGQPTWVWGGNEFGQYKVWNPSNFNVNYANSAGSATTASFLPNYLAYDGNSNWATYPWHKVASVTTSSAYSDFTITFLVTKGMAGDAGGILRARLRTNSAGTHESSQLYWLQASNLNASDFVAVYTNGSNSCTMEIWVKVTAQWEGKIFTVLSQSSRSHPGAHWTLYDTNGNGAASYTSGTAAYTSSMPVYTSGTGLRGAVWNDYAEYRAQEKPIEPGRVSYCNNNGKLKITSNRLQKFEGVVSDTFGFAIGETDNAKTPLAVSGRVLVYTYEPRDTFNSGDCVCAAPNGTVSKMTREEIVTYPDRIVGIVSEIPNYEIWGTGEVPVNGRIWIKVK